mgnify:CR=1 FL=1
MQLHQSSWPEIEQYLKTSTGIIVPIGSTEQHGPNGLLGTDAICPEFIARLAGDESGILIGPTFNVGSAQHHLGFPGTITLRPSTMIAAMNDWTSSLMRHGFERIYWFNGHGGNIAPASAAFSEIYSEFSFGRAGSNQKPVRLFLRNWWELGGVGEWMRVAHAAATFDVPVAPHWHADIHVHLVAAVPNALTVEYFSLDEDIYNFEALVANPLRVADGRILLDDAPGIGVILDEEAVERHRIGAAVASGARP